MNKFLMKFTATAVLAFMLACTPFEFAEVYGATGDKPVDDTYEIDFDPDDPALDDSEYDAALESISEDQGDASGLRLYDETGEEVPADQITDGEEGGGGEDPQNPVYDWFGTPGDNTGKISFLKNKKKKRYEYRSLAKQKVYGYDTFQGACSHGEFSWHVLFNRRNNRSRVIKVSMKTHKVVKVSKILALDHGNDLTYDEKRNLLVVIHYEKKPMRLTLLDPNTLKVKKVKNVKKLTAKVPGASKSFCKAIKGMTGIGYDADNDEYIVSIMGSDHYMALDAETFKILRVIKISNTPKSIKKYVRQGMTVRNGFIIRAYSGSFKYRGYNQNILFVFDSTGNFIKTCKLGTGYEIESVFFDGDKMFASTYRAYLKKKYKKVKITVRKNGKKKKKKVKRAYYVLKRDNNIIRIKKY